jgi:hypothetical protein
MLNNYIEIVFQFIVFRGHMKVNVDNQVFLVGSNEAIKTENKFFVK